MSDSANPLIRTFEFDGAALSFAREAGDWRVSAADLADALGCDRRVITRLVRRRAKEFKAGEAGVVSLTTLRGVQKAWAFSPRGVLRVAMLTESPRAAQFRDFAVDVLEQLRSGEAAVVTAEQVAALRNEVARLARALDEARVCHVNDLRSALEAADRRAVQSAEHSKELAGLAASMLARRKAQLGTERALKTEIKNGQRFLALGDDAASLLPGSN